MKKNQAMLAKWKIRVTEVMVPNSVDQMYAADGFSKAYMPEWESKDLARKSYHESKRSRADGPKNISEMSHEHEERKLYLSASSHNRHMRKRRKINNRAVDAKDGIDEVIGQEAHGIKQKTDGSTGNSNATDEKDERGISPRRETRKRGIVRIVER